MGDKPTMEAMGAKTPAGSIHSTREFTNRVDRQTFHINDETELLTAIRNAIKVAVNALAEAIPEIPVNPMQESIPASVAVTKPAARCDIALASINLLVQSYNHLLNSIDFRKAKDIY